jgi:LPS sulfotransferase NodH
MEITPFVPIIVEATKFFLNEVSEWLDHVRSRADVTHERQATAVQTRSELLAPEMRAFLESHSNELPNYINPEVARTNGYVIQGLVEQIQTHRRNMSDLERTEATFGTLVPFHIKRQTEMEATAILTKARTLGNLLSEVYRIE